MGFWNDLWKPIPVPFWNLNEMRAKMISSLSDASGYLEVAEYFVDDMGKLQEFRSRIDKTVEVLSLPDTVVKNYMTAMKIVQAVADLRGNIRQNPQRAAKAFGKLFSGIGELAHYLPFPVNSYIAIFAEAEDFFENIRVQMSPEVHMKERGLREVIDGI